MPMRVLVTGGAGYLGTVLCPILLSADYAVTVVDNFVEGSPVLAACCHFESFTPVRGDVRDRVLMERLLAKADIVIPLAALVGAPLCAKDPINATTTNLDAVRLIVEKASKDQLIIIPTTNSGYGIGEPNQVCTEETPLKPISLYGTTKVDAEKAVLDSGNGISLRLATVFGMSPQMRIDLLVNDFTYRAVADRAVVLFESHFKRNYIHIRDVAKAFVHAIEHYRLMSGQAFNVGLSTANLSKKELCEKIREQVPSFVFLEALIGEDPDKRNYIVSNAKLEGTGWYPDWSLERGIAELLKGYVMLRNNRYSNV